MLFKGGEDPQIALHTSIVVVADVIGDHLDQFPLAGKAFPIVALTLQNAPESLHGAVVNALGDTRHTLCHPGFFQFVMEGSVCVLETTVRMEDGMGVRIFLHSFVKGLEYKRVVISVSNHKGNDAPIIQVQNGAQIDLVDFNAFVPLELRYIGQPFLVGGLGMEVPTQYIFCNILRILRPPCTTMVAVLDGGLDIFLAADP